MAQVFFPPQLIAAWHLLVTLSRPVEYHMLYQAKITRRLGLLILLSLLFTISGCSTWFTGGFKDPQVRLVKVDVVKAKLLEQRFILRFRIDNPNDFSLPVRGLDYRVHLNEVQLAEGQSDTWFSVPARGHHVFAIPVRTNLWRHVRQVVRLLEEPDAPIRYRLEGAVKTGLFFGRSVTMARNGEIIPGDYIPE